MFWDSCDNRVLSDYVFDAVAWVICNHEHLLSIFCRSIGKKRIKKIVNKYLTSSETEAYPDYEFDDIT
jgi:hypothetical protein